MGGGDFSPITVSQILLASTGVFMASYINANIFGKLQLLLSSIGTDDQSFDLKKAQMDTTLIDLKLPMHLKLKVRG